MTVELEVRRATGGRRARNAAGGGRRRGIQGGVRPRSGANGSRTRAARGRTRRTEEALAAELRRQTAERALGQLRLLAIMAIGTWMLSAALAVWMPGMRAGLPEGCWRRMGSRVRRARLHVCRVAAHLGVDGAAAYKLCAATSAAATDGALASPARAGQHAAANALRCEPFSNQHSAFNQFNSTISNQHSAFKMIIVYGADWCEDTRRSLRHLRRLGVPHNI